MSKKNKFENKKQEKVQTDSYSLKTEAVDRLVNADKKTYPKTNVDPGKQYRSKGFLSRIPAPIKSLFIKFWFAGSIYYFIGYGLFNLDWLDHWIVFGIVMGIANDLLVNNSLRFFAVVNGGNDKYMMFTKKKYWTFFANILYSLVIIFIVDWIQTLLTLFFLSIGKTNFGYDPILFGISYTAVDMMFIGMKRLTIQIINDAKEKANVK